MTVNIHEAKTHFSKLIKRACQGEDIIISKAGVPVVRLVPVIEKSSERVSGTAKGKISISKNFDEPLPESIIKEFEN